MALFLREDDVEQLLPIPEAIRAVEEGFRLLATGEAVNYTRQRGEVPGAVLNVMWALAPTLGGMGVKIYPIVRTDVTQGSAFTFLLYGMPGGELQAILEANSLGQRRTGAASAVATKYLARPDSETLSIFGAGWQAESQVAAVVEVLPSLKRVLVVGRSPERAKNFSAGVADRTGLDVEVVEAEEAVRRADVLITATGSLEPVFDGAWLQPGTHVNAVGSNFASKAEVDAATVDRADLVVADSADVAKIECGDLIRAGFDWDRLVELAAVVAGEHPGRRSPDEVTLFESQGMALQDLVCAVPLVARAREEGLGMEIPG